MLKVKERLQQFEMTVLQEMLAQCTSSQQALFAKIFGPVSEIPADKRKTAMLLIERTLAKRDILYQSMSPQEFEQLEAGDTLLHVATGETWLVVECVPPASFVLIRTLTTSNFEEWQRLAS